MLTPDVFVMTTMSRRSHLRSWMTVLCCFVGALDVVACNDASRRGGTRAGTDSTTDNVTVIGADAHRDAVPVLQFEPTTQLISGQLQLDGIVDAVADSARRIFVLAKSNGRIAMTDRDLRPLAYIGGAGTQPGSFREPVAIGLFADGRVAVLDRALHRVSIFAVDRSGRSAALQRTIALKIETESMCTLPNGQLLIYGLADGQRMHVVDSTGARLRSFAPADSDHSPMAQRLLATGRIACDPANDEVIVTSIHTPQVEAFRISSGEQLWRDVLRPFRPIRMIDRGRSVSLESENAGYSRISAVFGLDDLWVIQTTYDARLDEATRDTVITYVYSRRGGTWLSPEAGLPLIFPVGGNAALSEHVRRGPGSFAIRQLKIAAGGAGSRTTPVASR
jgi:hypothetical protein